MFTQLCRARLWPKPKKKKNKSGTTSSSSSETSECPQTEDIPKKDPEDKSTIVDSPQSDPYPGFRERQDIGKEVTAVPSTVLKPKTTTITQQEDNSTKHSQLELYLNWLLKISDTQRTVSKEHQCFCCKSTDNPAYGLNSSSVTASQRNHTSCQKECPTKEQTHKDILTISEPSKESIQQSPQPIKEPCGRLQASITHKEGSRIRVSICKSKLKREKSGRSDVSAGGRSRLSCAGSTADNQTSKLTIAPSGNRVHKRRHSSAKRRMNRLQHQQAIEEVVNMFGKQFNKALMNQMKNNSGENTRATRVTAAIGTTDQVVAANQAKTTSVTVSKPVPKPPAKANVTTLTQTIKQNQIAKPECTDNQSDASEMEELQYATKERPAHIPMVVMQCSRFIPHLRKQPPFAESSLPMGSLVTALCRESEWLCVRTAHGQEGYVYSTCCVPLGTLPKKRTFQAQTKYNPQLSILKECVPSVVEKEGHQNVSEVKTKQLPLPKQRAHEKLSAFTPESTSTLLKKNVRKQLERLEPSTYVMTKDYRGVGDNALDLKKGDVVTGIKRQQEDWVLAKMESGEFGYIPLSYAAQVEFL